MKIPSIITTDEDKIKFLYRNFELLRLEHNQKGTDFKKGKITEKEFRNYQRSFCEPRIQRIFELINQIKEKNGWFFPTRELEENPETFQKMNLLIEKGSQETKWDSEIDISKIKKAGTFSNPEDPIEDFTTYTEVDPNAHITVTSSEVTFTGLTRGEDAYVYKDMGIDHFDGNFEHLIDITISASVDSALNFLWSLTNLIDDMKGIADVAGDSLSIEFYGNATDGPIIRIAELNSGTWATTANYLVTLGTTYYLKIRRDETVGTYGTLYCYIYSDSARTNLLTTLSLALTKTQDFRYIYVTQTYNSANTYAVSGSSANLDLQEIIQISVSDSGVGTDVVAIKGAVPITESGIGTDAIGVKQFKDIVDSGAGADIVAIKQFKTILDSGIGTEALEVKLVKAIQDSGIGTDLISAIKAKLTIADLGSGVETIGILSKVLVQD